MAAVSYPATAMSTSAQARRGKPGATTCRVLARSGSRVSVNNDIPIPMKVASSSSSLLSASAVNKNKIKVFEDGSKGIVCYRDESGEITCEGYDEGPRFRKQLSRFSCNPTRDSEIIDLL